MSSARRMLYESARTALADGWGIEQPRLRLVREAWNAVFDVRAASRRLALRLCSRRYHPVDSVRAELGWLEHLRSAPVMAPVPHRTAQGGLVHELPAGGPHHAAVLFDWIAGRRASGLSVRSMRAIGSLAAQLHAHSDRVGYDGARRPRWDAERLRRWWFEPRDDRAWAGLEPDVADAFSRSFDRLARVELRLERSHPSSFGLVHADLHRKNLVHTADGLAAIDFDDSGVACRLYELAVPLVSVEAVPRDPHAVAVVEGYRSVLALPNEVLVELPLYMAARAAVVALFVRGWLDETGVLDAADDGRRCDRTARYVETLLAQRPGT